MDILTKNMDKKGPSGLKEPSQMKTIAGPGKNTSNKYAGGKQAKLSIVGKKNR